MKDLSIIESDNQRSTNSRPFFSIGVTTYNRPQMLKKTLLSISDQIFMDFEVIVGNDFAQEPLSADLLGILDPRIRIVNHSQNLGEADNMNTLLNLSRGRYFTWQCDDDLYAPNFLSEVHSALLKFNYPICVFTAYEFIYGTSNSKPAKTLSGQSKILSGRHFLKMYLSGKLKAMGCTGVYDKKYLQQLGGVECLTETSTPLYSEHLLLVKAGLAERVCHINEPLIKYRIHEDAWGCNAKDLSLYNQASHNLIRKSVTVLSDAKLQDDFRQNITSLLNFVVFEYFGKARAGDGCLSRHWTVPYFFSLKKPFSILKGSRLYRIVLVSWGWTGVKLFWWMITKFNFKAAFSPILLKFAHWIR